MPKKRKMLTDFLPVPESEATFLNVEVLNNAKLRDLKVFILPSYLQKVKVPGFDSGSAIRELTSFARKVLDIVNSNLSNNDKIAQLKVIFKPIHEISSLGLGYSKYSSKGHGPDYDYLIQIGKLLTRVIEKWKATGELDELSFIKSMSLFVPHFGPDALSDLIASLIYPQLLDYTEFVLKKFGVQYSLSSNPEKVSGVKRQEWDSFNKKWVVSSRQFVVKGVHLTLVPYKLLTSYTSSFDVTRYISVFLLKKLRENDKSIDKAIKSFVRKEDFIKTIPNKKQYALDNTEREMSALTHFLQDSLNNGVGKALSGPSAIKYPD